MIVDDFNFHGAALSPSKANAPLVVDANAVLALRNEEVGRDWSLRLCIEIAYEREPDRDE